MALSGHRAFGPDLTKIMGDTYDLARKELHDTGQLTSAHTAVLRHDGFGPTPLRLLSQPNDLVGVRLAEKSSDLGAQFVVDKRLSDDKGFAYAR